MPRRALGPLPDAAQRQLEASLQQVQRILSRDDGAPLSLRQPRAGELGWIIQRHGELYAEEYGWNSQFEGLVAGICADFARTLEPQRERCWMADRGGKPVGSIMLVKHSATARRLSLRMNAARR